MPMKELSRLNPYLFRYKWHLFWGLVFVIISNVFQIVPAQLVRESIDLVINKIQVYRAMSGTSAQADFFAVFARGIVLYAMLILAMALLRGLFLYFVRQTLIVMSRRIEFDMKNDIFQHYQSLPLSFYRRNNTGDLMNRISEDVGRVRMYLGPSIMYGLQLFTLFFMLIPVMFMISVKLTLFALIPLPLLSFSIYYVNNIIERRSEEIQKSQSRLSTFVQEAFSGIRVIKSFNREDDSARRFSLENEQYKRESLRLTRVQALFFPLMLGLIGLSTILTVYEGSVEVINGSLTFGNIAEFIIYVNLLTWPVASLGWTSSQVQRAEASQGRINEFMRTQSDLISGEQVKNIAGKIEFHNVSFTYPDTGIQALKQVSFAIEPGESLAIIGSTGSGKSTVSNLITRLYDVSEGEIRIDELPIKQFDLTHLRRQIGYVPQAENSVLSKLIDANALELLAEITHLNNNVEPWENLAVAISFLKNDNKIPDSAVYLTQLETPQYHSYKHEDGSITRVIFEDQNEDLESDLDWYDYFVSNSKDDGVYGIIHASNVAPGYPYGIETGHYLLVNKKRVADNKTMEEIIAKAETYLGELNELFDLEGYVLLSTSEAEQLVSKISNISDVVDKLGRHYIELIFD